jgi:hypothetical protein
VLAVHRGVHGARYGFRGPYTEISVPGDTATRGRDPYTNQYFSRYLHTRPGLYSANVKPQRPTSHESELAALRDAADIVARTSADETDAIQARERYRNEGLPVIEPDPEIGARLGQNEQLVEMRPGAMVGRALLAGVGGAAVEDGVGTASSAAQAGVESLSGRLYLTSTRLVLLGRLTADGPVESELSVALGDIEELAVVGERLLVSLADGTGITIDAGRPRLLRVQIAAARYAARGDAQQLVDGEAVGPGGAFGLAPAAGLLEA